MKNFAVIVSALAVAGCATIIDGSSKPVSIQTNPSGAKFTISNREGQVISSGTTPQQITLKNGDGYFKKGEYTIKVSKPGYDDTTAEIHPNIAGWYFGNLLLGGAIGMLIVDPITGAMYKLPDTTVIPMRKLDTAELASSNADASATGNAATEAMIDSARWLFQAEKAAQAASCSSPSIINMGPGVELYTATCNQTPATIRCEFGKCAVQ